MKIVNELGFQGDVMFRKRAVCIPTEAIVQKEGEIVVAHSETGHHHVATGPELQFFPALSAAPLKSFLRVPKYADIEHRRDFDTHETIRLSPGDWDVVRQREWVPKGWRVVAD